MSDEYIMLTAEGGAGFIRPPELIAMFTWNQMTVRVVATYPEAAPTPGPFFVCEGLVKASMGERSWAFIPYDRIPSVVVAAAHEIRRLRERNKHLEMAAMGKSRPEDA